MYCKNCGKQIENNSRFCNYCGASQGEMRAAEEEKSGRSGMRRTGRERRGEQELRREWKDGRAICRE